MFAAFTRHVYSEIFNDSECLFCSDSAWILLGMFWPAFPPADPLWPWESVQRLLCPVAAQSTISLGSGILSTCEYVSRT